MTRRPSLPPRYFDDLYTADPDPWRFATSDYERAKYAATLAALPQRRFASALEVGCSIGVLTRQLATRCDTLFAVDVSETALGEARRRCADQPGVSFARLQVPEEWPVGRFDLILLSEVLYYFCADDIERTAVKSRAALGAGGVILLVHYILPTDYPTSGDEAAETFMRAAGLEPTLQQRAAAYRLDLLQAGAARPLAVGL